MECVSCIGNPNTDEWQYYIEGQARIGVFGTSDFFRIINGGTGNSEAQISNITVTAVPGPIAGTGIPALLGLVGLWAARRRRQKLAPL